MNYKMMGRFLYQILSIEAIFMLPALGISLYCGDAPAVKGFVYTLLISPLPLHSKYGGRQGSRR